MITDLYRFTRIIHSKRRIIPVCPTILFFNQLQELSTLHDSGLKPLHFGCLRLTLLRQATKILLLQGTVPSRLWLTRLDSTRRAQAESASRERKREIMQRVLISHEELWEDEQGDNHVRIFSMALV